MSKNEENEKRDIFISYSSKDRDIALKIRQAIASLNYSFFFDEDALPGSPEWMTEISTNINACKAVVFYRTDNSVQSDWCTRELRMAEQRGKKIIPLVNRARQHTEPDSPNMQALLVNLQNTYIDETAAHSVLKENIT